MSFTRQFTDPQGVTHEDAYFEVATANLTVNSYMNSNNSLADDSVENLNNLEIILRYKMFYWTSIEAKEAGYKPYTLGGEEPTDREFRFSGLEQEYADYATAAEAAEQHFLTQV